MSIKVTAQEDFFLYVPEMPDPEHSMAVTQDEHVDLPLGNDAWQRISLAGEVVVYAHLLDNDDQIACN